MDKTKRLFLMHTRALCTCI